MEQTEKFYLFITLKKCFKALRDHREENQR